jgi:hypothetical protein
MGWGGGGLGVGYSDFKWMKRPSLHAELAVANLQVSYRAKMRFFKFFKKCGENAEFMLI